MKTMRYVKLFEQFDKWDPFGEETETMNVEGPIIVINEVKKANYYVAQRIMNNKIYFFKNYPLPFDFTDWKIVKNINDDDPIAVYDRNFEFAEGKTSKSNEWRVYEYKDLPKEIKDGLKWDI